MLELESKLLCLLQLLWSWEEEMETWSQEAPRAEDTSTWKPTLIGPPAALPLLPMFPGNSDGRGCATLSSAPGTYLGFC